LKGTVIIETSGKLYEETAKWIEELGNAAGFPLKSKGIVILKIDEFTGYTGPAQGNGCFRKIWNPFRTLRIIDQKTSPLYPLQGASSMCMTVLRKPCLSLDCDMSQEVRLFGLCTKTSSPLPGVFNLSSR
jgi:hypothetical protein